MYRANLWIIRENRIFFYKKYKNKKKQKISWEWYDKNLNLYISFSPQEFFQKFYPIKKYKKKK